MKKSIPTFLVFSLLILGFSIISLAYVLFDASLWGAKANAYEHVSGRTELITITIPLNGFNKGGEIWYHGKLYDVGSFEVVNDSVVATVYHDNDEEQLVALLSACIEPNGGCINDGQVHLCKYRIYIPNSDKVLHPTQVACPAHTGMPAHTFMTWNEAAESYYRPVFAPPPKSNC